MVSLSNFGSASDDSMGRPSPPSDASDLVNVDYPSLVPGNIDGVPEDHVVTVESPPPSLQAGTTEEPGGSSSSSSSKGKKPVIITKDEEYFMESAFMVFQVEGCLFRVPSYLFSQESHVFGGMFRLPQPYTNNHSRRDGGDYSDTVPEGSSEANPIILPDEYTKKDFRCLLKALYPRSFTLRLTLTQDEWLSVLKLSTKWYFLNLRKTAISELELPGPSISPLSTLQSITHGRQYHVSSWLLSGLVDLVTREESINDDEALDIDAEYPTTAYRLFRTREKKIRGQLPATGLVKEVERLFKAELDQVRADEKAYETPEVERRLETPVQSYLPVPPEPTHDVMREDAKIYDDNSLFLQLNTPNNEFEPRQALGEIEEPNFIFSHSGSLWGFTATENVEYNSEPKKRGGKAKRK